MGGGGRLLMNQKLTLLSYLGEDWIINSNKKIHTDNKNNMITKVGIIVRI